MKQISFLPAPLLFHGGTLVGKKRKGKRPLNENSPVHLVLKSTKHILYANRRAIYAEILEKAKHFGLKAYGVAVNYDHIHLLLRLVRREFYNAFVRSLCGVLARRYGKGLWKLVPFSRVAHWGPDFKNLLAYCRKNRDEAAGIREYEPREDWYRKWKHAWTEAA